LIVVIETVLVGTTGLFKESTTLPENEKFAAPLPSSPSVMIYETVIIVPFCSFFPKYPSPNKSSYFSS